MILEIIDSVAKAFGKGADLAKPYIEEHFAQELENEYNERSDAWSNAQAIKDPIDRAYAEWPVLMRVLGAAGKTAGGVGTNVSIPSDTLAAFYEIANAHARDRKLLARFQYNLLNK